MRYKLGVTLTFLSALLIVLSILFLFGLIRFPFPYTTAAFGFLVYILGTLLSREGKLTGYRVVMLAICGLLILVALYREYFS
jgi:hypothetical protein